MAWKGWLRRFCFRFCSRIAYAAVYWCWGSVFPKKAAPGRVFPRFTVTSARPGESQRHSAFFSTTVWEQLLSTEWCKPNRSLAHKSALLKKKEAANEQCSFLPLKPNRRVLINCRIPAPWTPTRNLNWPSPDTNVRELTRFASQANWAWHRAQLCTNSITPTIY